MQLGVKFDGSTEGRESIQGGLMVTGVVEGEVWNPGAVETRAPSRVLRWMKERERLLVPAAALIVFLLAWQLASTLGLINQLFFASPSAVVSSGYHVVQTAQFWSDFRVSVSEFVVGYGMGLVSGLAAGFALGWFWRLRFIFRPWVDALNSIPGIALVPLVLIWFGLGFSSKIALIFLITFPVVVVNMYTATSSINPQYLRVGRSFGCSKFRLLRTIVFPSIAPFAFAAARIGVGRGVSGVVVGEYFAASSGLAYRLLQYGHDRQTGLLLFDALFITVVALGAFRVVSMVEKRVLHWRHVGAHSAFGADNT